MSNRAAPVLIVSASAGSGHVTAGHALRAAFERAGHPTVHADVLDLAPRWVRTAYGGGFELLATRAPGLWREVYRRSDGADCDLARWGRVARRLMFHDFERLLASRPWACCVCTHFLPAQLAARHSRFPPFASVVTDFALHRYWVQPGVRQYFVATPQVARDLGDRLPAATVTSSGIPVAASFGGTARDDARARLGIPQTDRVVLVMGGGMGLGVEAAAVAALDSAAPGLRVLAVCGRNGAARGRLMSLSTHDDRLNVFGYVADIAPLVAAADLVVSKPGGLTCSEVLAVGRPLVLTRGIPGHEEANVRYLTGIGAAVAADEPARITHAVRTLFGDAALLTRLAERARAAGRADAAMTIVNELAARFQRDEAA